MASWDRLWNDRVPKGWVRFVQDRGAISTDPPIYISEPARTDGRENRNIDR